MKKILRSHSTSVLAALALIFLAAIVASYAWGISYLVAGIDEANNSVMASSSAPQFNLDAAAQIDYRGISTSTGAGDGTLQQP